MHSARPGNREDSSTDGSGESGQATKRRSVSTKTVDKVDPRARQNVKYFHLVGIRSSRSIPRGSVEMQGVCLI